MSKLRDYSLEVVENYQKVFRRGQIVQPSLLRIFQKLTVRAQKISDCFQNLAMIIADLCDLFIPRLDGTELVSGYDGLRARRNWAAAKSKPRQAVVVD